MLPFPPDKGMRRCPMRICANLAARQAEHVARRERYFQAADVAPRRAVFKGARSGAVRRHRRAHITARFGRVRRVEQVLCFHGAPEVGEADARLDDRPSAFFFVNDLFNPIQLIGCQNHSAEWDAPADDAGTRAGDRDGRTLARRLGERASDFRCGVGKDNARGMTAGKIAGIGQESLYLIRTRFDQHREVSAFTREYTRPVVSRPRPVTHPVN